jgi:hypothetical protein
MEIRLPVKIPMIIISLLIILILCGGCTVNKEVAPANQGPFEIDAWCEIQEFNLTLVYNQTIVPVTEEDLKLFPEFGVYMHDGNDSLPAGNSGTRVVKVINCNATRAMQFLKVYRKFEEFPNQPVLEYRGHYYKVGYEYLQSHSTARPTIPMPS